MTNPEKILPDFYHHIDNGGLSASLFYSEPGTESTEGRSPYFQVSEGFFGYVTSSITVHAPNSDMLRNLGLWALKAADKLEVYEDKRGRQNA